MGLKANNPLGQGFWNNSDSYKQVTGLPVISAIRAITSNLIREKLNSQKQVRVLSLGIGSGALYKEYFLEEIKTGRLELYGIDILEDMVSLCKDQLPIENTKFISGNISYFRQIFTGSFDVIEAGLVFHHLLRSKDILNIFKDICNAISPSGIFILGDIDVRCGEHIEKKLSSLEALHGALKIDLATGEFYNENVRIPILENNNSEDIQILDNLEKLSCGPLLREVENLEPELREKLRPLILSNIASAKKGLEWHRNIDSWMELIKQSTTEEEEISVFNSETIRHKFFGVLDNPFVLVMKNSEHADD